MHKNELEMLDMWEPGGTSYSDSEAISFELWHVISNNVAFWHV